MRNQKKGNFDVIGILKIDGEWKWRLAIICSHCGKEVIDIDEAWVYRASHVRPGYKALILHSWCENAARKGPFPALYDPVNLRSFLVELASTPNEYERQLLLAEEYRMRALEEDRLDHRENAEG